MSKRVIVAVTGASGSIYARLTLLALLRCDVEQIVLVQSKTGIEVSAFEHCVMPSDKRITTVDNDDMFNSIASGSANYDAMIVIPCSMGCIGRIASGVSSDLIARAADVMLKERRRLILCPRETPYSLIHLRGMTTITEAGGIIAPLSPSFYSDPSDTESLCNTVVERVLTLAGVDSPHYIWNGK